VSLIDQIVEALAKVQDPELRHPITDLGMVEDLKESDGAVRVTVLLTISACPMQDRLRNDVTTAITSVSGVTSVDLTFGVMTEEQRNNVKKIVRGGREKFIPFAQPDSLTRVIGIASGKGGVGKSSVTANLAVAAAKKGLNVGILDADVYGHSIPRLMGLMGQRPTAIDQMFIPLESYGVKTVSMEMFKPERSDPVAYRGPLLVIENMSQFPCPSCGEPMSLFGEGGGEETSRRLSQLVGSDVPLLGKIPFSPALRTGGDDGAPIVESDPTSFAAVALFDVAEKIVKRNKSLLGVRLGIST